MNCPLAGYTIVEACENSRSFAAASGSEHGGQDASDLGARIVKFEPPGGDPIRRLPVRPC